MYEQSVLYFSASPRSAHSSDQSFYMKDTGIAQEKSALGTAPTNSPNLGICLTVNFVFMQSFKYSGLIKVPLSLTLDFIS